MIGHVQLRPPCPPRLQVITRYSSYLFMLTTLVPGIPVLAIVVRYYLQSSGLCSRIGATFCGVIAPGVIALFLYNTPYFVKSTPPPRHSHACPAAAPRTRV